MKEDVKKKDFEELMKFMETQFPKNAIQTYNSDLSLSDLTDNGTNIKQLEYLHQYKDFVTTKLNHSLSSIICKQQQWSENGFNLGLKGDVLSEILHHCALAHTKCSTFFGREKLIEQAMNCIQQSNRDLETKFAGISVYIVGVSGAGKTALMAKVADEIFKNKVGEAKVIIRFCGTSPGSKNAWSLMINICAQIEYVFELQDRKSLSFQNQQQEYDSLVSYFHSLLLKYPLLLFIDSLDQLTNDNQGRSELSFLKGVKLQIHVLWYLVCRMIWKKM
jgi:hypothetical protein